MPKHTAFYDVKEMMDLLGISESMAYRHIRELNAMICEKGYRSPRAGLVSKKLVHEVFLLNDDIDIPEKFDFEKENKKVVELKRGGKRTHYRNGVRVS